jgi:GNAT superfamily N-acetyltransferase
VKLDSDEGRRLADSIEARATADMYAAAPRALDCRVEAIAGATLLLSPRIPASYFNRVIGLGVLEPATQAALDAVHDRFRAAGVAEYWLHLNPAARPESLAGWLAARGLAPPPRRSWAKFLRGPQLYAARPCALSVRPAEQDDADAIARVVCSAYGMPAALAPWFAALVGRDGWRFVVAEADGRAAATGAVFVAGTTAWLGVGATLAEYRNRGAQGALLAARIALAAGAGCTVLATETGESIAGEANPSLNNIRRAGFVQVCSRLNYAATTR